MKDSGKIISDMEKANKSGQMAKLMKETTTKIKEKAKESTDMLMSKVTQVNGRTMSNTDLELSHGQVDQSIKGPLLRINSTVKACIFMLMAALEEVNGQMINASSG